MLKTIELSNVKARGENRTVGEMSKKKRLLCWCILYSYILAVFVINFNFNFVLPKVNTDYMSQAQVLNIDKLRLIINLRKFNENVK